MKIPNPISCVTTCSPRKIINALILINLLVFGIASVVHASELTISPAAISETYELYTENEKLLTLTNTTDASIDYTIELKTLKNGSPGWLTIRQESGTLGSNSNTDLNLTIKGPEAFPFDQQSKLA